MERVAKRRRQNQTPAPSRRVRPRPAVTRRAVTRRAVTAMERDNNGSLTMDPISLEPIPSKYAVKVNRKTYDARHLKKYWNFGRVDIPHTRKSPDAATLSRMDSIFAGPNFRKRDARTLEPRTTFSTPMNWSGAGLPAFPPNTRAWHKPNARFVFYYKKDGRVQKMKLKGHMKTLTGKEMYKAAAAALRASGQELPRFLVYPTRLVDPTAPSAALLVKPHLTVLNIVSSKFGIGEWRVLTPSTTSTNTVPAKSLYVFVLADGSPGFDWAKGKDYVQWRA